MIRRTLLTLALLAAPAMRVAQQPSAMQGQTPAADTSKAAATKGKLGGVGVGRGAARGEGEPHVGAVVRAARLQGEAVGVERYAGGAGRGEHAAPARVSAV